MTARTEKVSGRESRHLIRSSEQSGLRAARERVPVPVIGYEALPGVAGIFEISRSWGKTGRCRRAVHAEHECDAEACAHQVEIRAGQSRRGALGGVVGSAIPSPESAHIDGTPSIFPLHLSSYLLGGRVRMPLTGSPCDKRNRSESDRKSPDRVRRRLVE